MSVGLEAKDVGGLEVWHSAGNRGTQVRFPVAAQSFHARKYLLRRNIIYNPVDTCRWYTCREFYSSHCCRLVHLGM